MTIDLSSHLIYIICNHDVVMTSFIVYSLKRKRASNICLLVPLSNKEFQKTNLGVQMISGKWTTIEDFTGTLSTNVVIVISMLYHDYESQYKLFQACILQQVSFFVTWDSGMELENFVRNSSCPRTRLHQLLLDYHSSESPDKMNWVLFQVGIFDIESIHFDISTVTSSFNSPNQFIFLNVTVKEDLALLISESIINTNLEPNRNYVVGEFIAHTFLGHIYQVFNKGVQYDLNLPASINEFETTNQLRLSGIISARPLPQIIFPNHNLNVNKLSMEISLQYGASIYRILSGHRRITLKEWVYDKLRQRS
ncbi:17880_t:CDS:2 [Funneliformis geosporum]|uniref:12429_t:CDS:1 n=1 Tax=Funneliformis geosporum TaxID=1117311 RepID=A0A9W4T3J6_9GLOM|nr:12429_t:CDS:2 [Funneliformis geosporum]CAI2191696.1 17880_t:CDS:2 [Funneliformis geosporum]